MSGGKKFSHLSWLQRRCLTDACQRMFFAVSDYRVGEDTTIAADLFKMGADSVIEHGGERYVYVEQTVKTIPILFPTLVMQGLKRESDGLWASAEMIHKMVLSDRNLPLPLYPKFHKPSWLWGPWFVVLAVLSLIVGVVFFALLVAATILVILFSLFMDVVWDRVRGRADEFRIPRKPPVGSLTDEEAMRLARKRDF